MERRLRDLSTTGRVIDVHSDCSGSTSGRWYRRLRDRAHVALPVRTFDVRANIVFRRLLEVEGLIVLFRQRLCLHIPLDSEYRRTC